MSKTESKIKTIVKRTAMTLQQLLISLFSSTLNYSLIFWMRFITDIYFHQFSYSNSLMLTQSFARMSLLSTRRNVLIFLPQFILSIVQKFSILPISDVWRQGIVNSFIKVVLLGYILFGISQVSRVGQKLLMQFYVCANATFKGFPS